MDIRLAIKAITLLLLLDGLWITCMFDRYSATYQAINGKKLKVNIVGAVLAYGIIAIAIFFVLYPMIVQKTKTVHALLNGALLGFCMYGMYNATNYALIQNYDSVTAIIDTIWGTLLFTVLSWVLYKHQRP